MAFAQGAKDLALLAAIPLDNSAEKFSRGVSRAFDKTREGKTRSFLPELFVAYAADYPATSGQFSPNFQRAIEQAGKPLIDAVKSCLRQAPAGSAAATVVAPQLEAYEQMLRDKERRRQEEIERKRRKEEEAQRRRQEEIERKRREEEEEQRRRQRERQEVIERRHGVILNAVTFPPIACGFVLSVAMPVLSCFSFLLMASFPFAYKRFLANIYDQTIYKISSAIPSFICKSGLVKSFFGSRLLSSLAPEWADTTHLGSNRALTIYLYAMVMVGCVLSFLLLGVPILIFIAVKRSIFG